MKRLMSLIVVIVIGFSSLNALTIIGGTGMGAGTAVPASVCPASGYNHAQPAVTDSVTIGTGNELARFPMNFWMRNSLYETLYLADELGFNAGTITSLAIYNHFTDDVTNGATQIYMGSTDRSDLSDGYIPASQLSLVFDGNVVYPSGENTIRIDLQTPYMHTGGNLVLMFVRPMDQNYYSPTNLFKCQTAGRYRARYSYNHNISIDPFNPPTGSYTGQFPQTTFFYTSQSIENDLGVTGISGNYTPSVGTASGYTLRVCNSGTQAQTDYVLKLMGPGDEVLASLAGPAINSMQTLDVEIPWTPTTAGETAIYGMVEMTGDEISTNNQTHALEIDVQPEGVHAITIGIGNELSRYPLDFGFRNSIHETLYLADELGFGLGSITSLTLYSLFSSPVIHRAAKIYMGSTGQTDLSDGFIPASELSLVFDGNIDCPAGEHSIPITLQVPYLYTGGNLVLMFVRSMDSPQYLTTNYFKSQSAGDSRSRHFSSNSVIPDPCNPPEGSDTGQFPRITLFHTRQLIQDDLGALSISGDSNPTLGAASAYTIQIRNNGTAAQDAYTVKLMGPGDEVLASVAGPQINSMQTVEVELTWTPTATGATTIYAKLELAADEISTNNRTPELNLMVDPADAIPLTVGDGSQTARLPVDMSWNHSLFQTLYFPDEMGDFAGQITGLRFYNDFDTNLPNTPISIWLGTTTQTSLEDGCIPSTQLSLVYEGPVDLPSGENTVIISFDEPYLYVNRQNLVLMIYKTAENHYPTANLFKCQTVGTNRSRKAISGSELIDPAHPPNAALSGQFPLTTFMVIPGGVGHIFGTVTDTNSQPLSGAVVSLNDGAYSTTTNTDGQYQLINIWPNSYTISFSAHGYHEHTQTVVLAEDDTLTINVTMQLLPQVNVSGEVVVSATEMPVQGALIRLSGYESYSASTNADGIFTIPGVYADRTYDYSIIAAGYYSVSGQVTIGFIDHNMGQTALHQLAYAPLNVTAVLDDAGDAVDITWQAPNFPAPDVVESFEGETFPPENWTQIITNDGPATPLGIYPTWCRFGELIISGELIAPTQGSYQAGLFTDGDLQDEWLITPAFNCPSSAYLTFDSYVYLGSTQGDHYCVQASADDGVTWNVLWDASAQTGGWNRYSNPITVDLSAYVGEQLKIAFRAIGADADAGLGYPWFIDNIYIGDGTAAVRFTPRAMTAVSASPQLPSKPHLSRHTRTTSEMPTGYIVYRLQSHQEHDFGSWVTLAHQPGDVLSFSDPAWASLPGGDYRWAIRALYMGDIASVPSFSNVINKETQFGMIVGMVKNKDDTGIEGATVTCQTQTATTNSVGAYTLMVPVGYYSVTASAEGFNGQTVDGVLVEHNLSTTVNFTLQETSSDENRFPVVSTALDGNHPNPFNPETTIKYSVKQPGPVKLAVYNIKGQLIRTLVDEVRATGRYKLIFDGRDERGRLIASGVYLLRMLAPGYQKTRKLMLMK
jgi:hypothetical protein